jgi:CRISPR-associated exonuclease Cas4
MTKSSVLFSESQAFEITCTDVLEHCFCPRFTYFEHVLVVPERQEKWFKVQKGREVHERVQSINRSYLRKKIGCVERRLNVHLSSEDGLIGVVDEVLTLDDGTMAPLDYKFAEYPGHVYKTHRLQAAFYGRLIEGAYRAPVRRAFLVYTRPRNKLVEVPVGDRERELLRLSVSEIKSILTSGRIPERGASRGACRDCCYRNICDRGLE